MRARVTKGKLETLLDTVNLAKVAADTPVRLTATREADEGRLSARVRTHTLSVATDCPVELDVPGNATVRLGTTRSMAHAMAGPLVELNGNADGLVLCSPKGKTGAGFRATLNAVSAHEDLTGPAPRNPDAPACEMAVGDLLNLLRGTLYAAGRDDKRAMLMGVLLRVRGEKMQALATDGHRMAMATAPAPAGDVLPAAGVVLHRDAATCILALCEALDAQKTVRVSVEHKRMVLVAGDTLVHGALIEGLYPDVDTVMTPVPESSVVLSLRPGAVKESLDRVEHIQPDADMCRLSAKDGELLFEGCSGRGEARDGIDVDTKAQTPVLGINIRYLREAVNQMDASGDIDVCVPPDNLAPVHVCTAGSRAVIMPMRI